MSVTSLDEERIHKIRDTEIARQIQRESKTDRQIQRVNGFNVVYQQFIAMYDSGCQISCNWSRLKTGINVPAHPTGHLKLTGPTRP